jgi:raffinose/stachyose/melibiose transport system permease protein
MTASTVHSLPQPLADQASAGHRPGGRGTAFTVAVFLAPAVLLYLLFLVYPILQAGYFSLYRWNGFGPATEFVGLNNYVRVLTDIVFLRSVAHALAIVALSIVVQLPLSLGLALLVGRNLPGRAFFRALFFLPYVLSEVMTAIIWASLYNPDPEYGLLNALLTSFGFKAQAWLGNPSTVLLAVFVALTWKYFGLHMLLYLAGLQNIPREVEEAAEIDGASRGQTLAFITLPLLGSTIRLTIYLSVLGSLQQFGLVWVMSQGGPVHASEMLATYLYHASFVQFAFGYGSAVALVMLLMCLVFSVSYQRLAMRQDYEGIGE